MTANDTTIEPRARNWGGARPGAGAPRGNRNNLKARRDDPLAFLSQIDFASFIRLLPPATGALVTLALGRALAQAVAETNRLIGDLGPAERERAFKQACLYATQLLLTNVTDAWQVRNRSRNQREAAIVRALGPWLGETSKIAFTLDALGQSRSESPPSPSIKVNQDRGPSNPAPRPASLPSPPLSRRGPRR